MHTGEAKTPGGRAGRRHDGGGISDSLDACGFELARFKTGTPCRLNGRTIDFAKCELQPGDDDPQPFSASRPSASRSRRWIATSPTRTRRCTS